MRICKTQPAFTIVELLVVIVVIGILAAIIVVSYIGLAKKADIATLQSDLSNSKNTLGLYYSENGSYPTAFDSNNCPTTPVSSSSYCLKLSGENTVSSYTGTADNYSLSIARGDLKYSITPSTAPQEYLHCPTGFIPVPGSSTYGTSDFCVMKYEAKNDGAGKAVSQPNGSPWVNISQTTAMATATAACTGCHLITEAEWMTIAKNVLSVPSNWSTGTVGSGYIFSGHNDNAPANSLVASSNDSDGYYGTGNTTGSNQKRTLTLTNGETIWDLAGNVWEWTAGQTTGGQPGVAAAGYAWREWTAITTAGTLTVNPFPSGTGLSGASAWNSSNGIGQLDSNADETGLRGFIRGGSWISGGNAGVLALNLSPLPSSAGSGIGWRVSSPGL